MLEGEPPATVRQTEMYSFFPKVTNGDKAKFLVMPLSYPAAAHGARSGESQETKTARRSGKPVSVTSPGRALRRLRHLLASTPA